MERRTCAIRWPAIAAGLLLTAAGCKTALISAGLLWNGYDVPAEFDGLKDKKVAVVCKMVSPDLSSSHPERALAEAICERLKANSKKIKIHLVSPQKVAVLIDDKGLEDPIEIGKQLKAEKVVAVSIESFNVNEGQTLYRGRSSVTIHVYDVASGDDEWHKTPSPIEYPAIAPTPAQDMSEPEFRNHFIDNLADRIARYFYSYDRYDRDADSMR